MIKDKKILVVGAGGFIGGHLVKKLLDNGNSIVSTDIKPKEYWFQDFETAENYYSTNQYEKVKKILQNFNKDDQFYYWFRTKKETQIIMKENGEESGIEFITLRFNKFEKPNLKVIFDIANFFKNSKKYEKAAQYYSQIIPKFEKDSTIKSDLLYRRGSSYERLKRYKESDEDFLSSMKVNPNDAYVLNYLAYSWLERDYKIDEAMSMLKKAYSLKNDDPYIVVGAPGGTYITMGVLQSILNVIEFDMNMQEAVSAPRFTANSNAIDVTNRIPRFITKELEENGYEVIRNPFSYGFAGVHGIRVKDGIWDGGADPGRDGMVLIV